jgi:hypothetical protein
MKLIVAMIVIGLITITASAENLRMSEVAELTVDQVSIAFRISLKFLRKNRIYSKILM